SHQRRESGISDLRVLLAQCRQEEDRVRGYAGECGCGEFDSAFDFTVFDEPSCELQTLRYAELRAGIVATLICGSFVALFLVCFVQDFEKLFAEFAIALGDESQDFTANIRTAANNDWLARSFQPLHFFGAFLCGFGVDDFRRFARSRSVSHRTSAARAWTRARRV